MTVADELQARALFEQRYGAAAAPVAVEIERRVIGGDWGANGYTTIAQADQLAAGLQLSAANRLLDIGTGRGWPGLYLAARSGCRVVLADLPLEGLRVAAARAQTEALAARSSVLVAAASAPLPRRQLRRHHPHRRAVLTARQALRAESLQAAPWAGRAHGLLHDLRNPGPATRGAAAGTRRRSQSRRHAQQPPSAAPLGRLRGHHRTRRHGGVSCHRHRLAGRVGVSCCGAGPAGATRRLPATAGRPACDAGRHRHGVAAPRPAGCPTGVSVGWPSGALWVVRHCQVQAAMAGRSAPRGGMSRRSAIRPGRTRLVWVETPANPMWEITDLVAVCELAHAAGARVAVDNTVATPVHTRPWSWVPTWWSIRPPSTSTATATCWPGRC